MNNPSSQQPAVNATMGLPTNTNPSERRRNSVRIIKPAVFQKSISFNKLLLLLFSTSCMAQQDDKPGFCDGCFCIKAENETCPTELQPNMNFSSFLPHLLEFELENPATLDCNPYIVNNETLCNLQPEPLQQGGTCVLGFTPPANYSLSCPTQHTYAVRTFAGTKEEATVQGLFVTHAGPCGACSTLQDLYVYMSRGEGLREAATSCGIRGLANTTDGIVCYQELGFTPACAAIWYYNTQNTQNSCLDVCLKLVSENAPINGPPPDCPANACIECDEVNSGPLFLKYAGRTRRNSGLLSSIARTCDELIYLPQVDPCEWLPSPTNAPTTSSGARQCGRWWWLSAVLVMMQCVLLWALVTMP